MFIIGRAINGTSSLPTLMIIIVTFWLCCRGWAGFEGSLLQLRLLLTGHLRGLCITDSIIFSCLVSGGGTQGAGTGEGPISHAGPTALCGNDVVKELIGV